jgi:UDP-2,3-diacylglucosamine hydrolase
MASEHPTLFISDLHLSENQPHLNALFEYFITHIACKAKALYILGDFFNYWFSDKQQSPFIDHTKSLLTTLVTQGIPVWLMVGNRDFMLGERFAGETGCTLLQDPSVIQIAQQRIVLTHGDMLCTDDISYMRYRRIIRSRPMLYLARHLPLCLLNTIAQNIRKHSANTAPKPSSQLAINQHEAEKTCEAHKAQYLLHGHTHVAGEHQLHTTSEPATRLVLNAWEQQGHYLSWPDDGRYQFHSFDLPSKS